MPRRKNIANAPPAAPPVLRRAAYQGLQDFEAEFCEAYLVSYDLGYAADAVGLPKNKRIAKARALFSQTHIQKALDARKAELTKSSGVYVEQIRDEARSLAFFDVGRLFTEVIEEVLDANGKPALGEDGKPVRRKVIYLKSLSEIDTRAVSALDVTNTPDGPRIKVRAHDKLRAIELIGRDAGAFQDDTKPLPNVSFHIHFDGEKKSGRPPKPVNPNGEKLHGSGA